MNGALTILGGLHAPAKWQSVDRIRNKEGIIVTGAASLPAQGSRYIPDLSIESQRADLTPAAVDGFIKLAEIWRLNSKQASTLLGEGSDRTWFRIKSRGWTGILSQDALTRISAMIGIYKGLHLLFSNPLADEWVRRPNSETLFEDKSPVDYMMAGGIPAMLETRGYIDALRGGL